MRRRASGDSSGNSSPVVVLASKKFGTSCRHVVFNPWRVGDEVCKCRFAVSLEL
jgi:hypothetical protein